MLAKSKRFGRQSYPGKEWGASLCAIHSTSVVTNHPPRPGSREMVIFLITAFRRKGGRGELILPEAFVREAKGKLG